MAGASLRRALGCCGLLTLGSACRGCDQPDPVLDPLAVVVEEAGALDQLPPAEALAAVRRAREARDLPSLASHEARLVLELDGLAAAVAVLDRAVERFPRSPGLRWDRAALRARAGQLEEAAADLRGPVGRGELLPAALGRDPDLAALGGDPRYASLVRLPEVKAVASGSPDGIVGDRWSLELSVDAPAGEVEVEARGPVPVARLTEVVEDVLAESALQTERRLQWRGVLTGEVDGRVGPWEVRVGASSTTTSPVPLEVSALGTAEAARSGWPTVLPVPSTLRGGAALPVARRVGASLFLAAPAHLELDHPGDCVRLEQRSAGRRDWHGALCGLPGEGRWAVRNGETVVLEGALGASEPPAGG